jgi:hypothetical protein
MMSPKKMTPSTRGTTRRQLMTIQLTFTTIVKATKHTPKVIKKAIDFVRVEMRMKTATQDIVAKELRKQNHRAFAFHDLYLLNGPLIR